MASSKGLHTRRIDLPVHVVRDTIDRFLNDYFKTPQVEVDGTPDHFSLDVKGNPPGAFFFSPSPRTNITIELEGKDEYTLVGFDKKLTTGFRNWILTRMLLFMIPTFIFPFAYLWVITGTDLNLPFVICYCFPQSLVSLPLGVVILENVRIDGKLPGIERTFWDALENQGDRTFAIQDAIKRRRSDMIELAAGISLSTIPFLIAMFLGGFTIPAISFGIFFIVPLFCYIAMELVSHRLPFRFRFGPKRTAMSLSWFMFIFLPFATMLGTYRDWTLAESSPSIEEVIYPMVYTLGVPLLLTFLVLVMVAGGAAQTVFAYQVKYRSLLASPSGGLENVKAPSFWLFLYRILGILTFLFLASGTIVGVWEFWRKLSDPIWRVEYRSYLLPQARGYVPFFQGRMLEIVTERSLIVYLGILFVPLFLTIGFWLGRIF